MNFYVFRPQEYNGGVILVIRCIFNPLEPKNVFSKSIKIKFFQILIPRGVEHVFFNIVMLIVYILSIKLKKDHYSIIISFRVIII